MSSFDGRLKIILENLATLEAVRDHGKLRIAAAVVADDDDDATADITVTTHRLQIEDRWFEGMQRSRTGDGRRMTLAFVGRLLDEVERLADQARDEHLDPHDHAAGPANSMFEVDPLEALQQLSCAVRDANRGLSRLKSTTYADAEQVVLDLTVLIARADAIAARINQFLIEPHKPAGAAPAAWGPPL